MVRLEFGEDGLALEGGGALAPAQTIRANDATRSR
jgi:hypothetical protein